MLALSIVFLDVDEDKSFRRFFLPQSVSTRKEVFVSSRPASSTNFEEVFI
jgi:hypothetical protein